MDRDAGSAQDVASSGGKEVSANESAAPMRMDFGIGRARRNATESSRPADHLIGMGKDSDPPT